jgi:hypothetical protein
MAVVKKALGAFGLAGKDHGSGRSERAVLNATHCEVAWNNFGTFEREKEGFPTEPKRRLNNDL